MLNLQYILLIYFLFNSDDISFDKVFPPFEIACQQTKSPKIVCSALDCLQVK